MKKALFRCPSMIAFITSTGMMNGWSNMLMLESSRNFPFLDCCIHILISLSAVLSVFNCGVSDAMLTVGLFSETLMIFLKSVVSI